MTIQFLILLELAFFVLHEFEEIITIEIWYKRNEAKIKSLWPVRKPFGLDQYGDSFREKNMTASIAFAIMFQVVFFVLLSTLSIVFDGYLIWYGAILGSLVMSTWIHLRLAIRFRQYTPGIITTIVFFVPMVWVFYKSTVLLNYGIVPILISTILTNVLSAVIVFQVLHPLVKVTQKFFGTK
ncbi:MAG: HXXEE domain-containing protein [Candidatus Izemoplasmatales bacterium]